MITGKCSTGTVAAFALVNAQQTTTVSPS